MNPEHEDEGSYLVQCFAALSQPVRLDILSALAAGACTAAQLAERLTINETALVKQITPLRESGLISLRTSTKGYIYAVNQSGWAAFKKAVAAMTLTRPAPPVSDNAWIDALPPDFTDAERDELRHITFDGKLAEIPSASKRYPRLLLVIRWLATRFEPGATYTEREVNARLSPINEDFATLRRYLVDLRVLNRERGGAKYWLAAREEWLTDPNMRVLNE